MIGGSPLDYGSMWSLSMHLVLTLAAALGGWQDWCNREVSNWLTIPLWLAGVLGVFWRLFKGDVLTFAIVLILTWAALRAWMAGGDYKMLVSLFGLWPLGGLVALVGTGIWGGIVLLRTRDQQSTFPGVTAMFFVLALTFCVEVSIILISLLKT